MRTMVIIVMITVEAKNSPLSLTTRPPWWRWLVIDEMTTMMMTMTTMMMIVMITVEAKTLLYLWQLNHPDDDDDEFCLWGFWWCLTSWQWKWEWWSWSLNTKPWMSLDDLGWSYNVKPWMSLDVKCQTLDGRDPRLLQKRPQLPLLLLTPCILIIDCDHHEDWDHLHHIDDWQWWLLAGISNSTTTTTTL